jgi:hypothetical protein
LQHIYRDTETPGLGVRVSATNRSYIFERRVHGRCMRTNIGDVRTWALGEARAEARRLAVLIDRGEDPRAEAREKEAAARAKIAQERRSTVTLAEARAEYTEARRPRWSLGTIREHAKAASPGGIPRRRVSGLTRPGPLAPLMSMRLADLKPEAIAAWLESQAKRRPTRTALAFRFLRTFSHWAADMSEYKGLIPSDAFTARQVRDKVPTIGRRQEVLQKEMLPVWFAAVQALQPVVSAYLQTLLLLGCRRMELAELR